MKANGQDELTLAQGGVKKGSISATKITADGRRIPLGKVAHTNPTINALLQLKLRFFKLIGRI